MIADGVDPSIGDVLTVEGGREFRRLQQRGLSDRESTAPDWSIT